MTRMLKQIFLLALVAPLAAPASRVKDLTLVEGGRENQLVGYGLVVGLAGDGDSNAAATLRSVANILQRYGLTINPTDIKAKNSAAVMITAEIGAFLKPGARMALDTTVVATGKGKDFRIEAVAEGNGLVTTCLYFTVLRTLKIPRLPTAPPLNHLAQILSTLPAQPVDGNDRPVTASVNLAIAGDRLLLRVDTTDARLGRGVNLWDGSSMELFVAPQIGAPRLQLVVAPAFKKEPPKARLVSSAGLVVVKGLQVTGTTSASGWMLAVSVPLKEIGLDPSADKLALDLVVNATRTGHTQPCRTHLAGAFNPFEGSANYLHVTTQTPAKTT